MNSLMWMSVLYVIADGHWPCLDLWKDIRFVQVYPTIQPCQGNCSEWSCKLKLHALEQDTGLLQGTAQCKMHLLLHICSYRFRLCIDGAFLHRDAHDVAYS